MIQLSYQPAYDPYHTAFRLLRISGFRSGATFKLGQIRILDFYLAFPMFIQKMRLPRNFRSHIKLAGLDRAADTYGQLPDPTVVFHNMAPIQDAALQTLSLQGFLRMDKFLKGTAERSSKPLPAELEAKISKRNQEQAPLMNFLTFVLSDLPYEGVDGLKHRSGLAEHRYDVA